MEYQIKDVVDYEGLYEVDTEGNVWSLNYNKTRKRQKLRGAIDGAGYLTVNLCKNRTQKTYTVHRLVAEAFIPNPQNLPQVNHKDECKSNNRVDNLEFCDCRYNMLYSGNHLKGCKAAVKVNSKPILQYTLDGEFVKEYPSITEASRQTGIWHSNISNCCNGHKNYSHAGNYKWRYKQMKINEQ